MISIFTPTTKVHMQRDVMRATDTRLVKHSQKGIFLSLLVFFAVMLVGEYYEKSPTLTIIMAVGLTLVSIIRGFFLYKFEYLYAQGPARWRNLFFCFSLLGSSWWGFIVAEITYVNGFYNETPVLWLYTIAFFAGGIYVFSPFERFLRIYMFVAFAPCAIVAIVLLQPVSVLYASIMISVYFLLCRQGAIIGKNYWDKLQVNYDLLQRANALEAQRITTQSSLENQDLLFRNVIRELTSSVNEIMSGLQLINKYERPEEDKKIILLAEEKTQQQIYLLRNISQISKLSEKNIAFNLENIDIRYIIENSIAKASSIAYKQGIELYTSFSKNFPSRAVADSNCIEQLISNLIASACHFSNKGELLFCCTYDGSTNDGIVNISIVNRRPVKTPESIEKINTAFSMRPEEDLFLGLNLAIIKDLSEAMGGRIDVGYNDENELIFNAGIKLDNIDTTLSKNKAIKSIEEKKLILYQVPETISSVFKETLQSLGLHVMICYTEDETLAALKKASYDGVLIYSMLDNLHALSLSKTLAEHETFRVLPQILLLSEMQKNTPEVTEHLLKYQSIELLYKPIENRQLKKSLKKILANKQRNDNNIIATEDLLTGRNILVYQQEEIDYVILGAMLSELGCNPIDAGNIESAKELFDKKEIDAFICESHIEKMDMKKFVSELREGKAGKISAQYVPPILGLTSHSMDNEETQCLASGMDYYIDSPTNIDDLKAILRRFIGRATSYSHASNLSTA